MREKCPNTDFFSGPYFPVFGLPTEIYGVKYGPEIKYLDIFHAVHMGPIPRWITTTVSYFLTCGNCL